MEAKIFVAMDVINFAACLLSRCMGCNRGFVDDKRWMNMLEKRRYEGDQVLISHGERIKYSDETPRTAVYRQLKPKMRHVACTWRIQKNMSIQLSGRENMPAHFWAVTSPFINFLVIKETFLVSILVILLCR